MSSFTRVAALYDIHGNLPALEAVLDDVAQADVDAIVVGGDIFPGPLAREVLERLAALDVPTHWIRGNGDRAVVQTAAGVAPSDVPEAFVPLMEWHAAGLDRAQLDAVSAWPLSVCLDIGALGPVLFCHATPRDDNEHFVAATPEELLRGAFAQVDAGLVVCGHTHRPFTRSVGPLRVVNAGSVGMAFTWKEAEWLLLHDDVEFRRTPYDLAAAAARVRASDYPRRDEFADTYLTVTADG